MPTVVILTHLTQGGQYATSNHHRRHYQNQMRRHCERGQQKAEGRGQRQRRDPKGRGAAAAKGQPCAGRPDNVLLPHSSRCKILFLGGFQ